MHADAASRGVDAAALGEQQPSLKASSLHREADVDRELEQQPLAVVADVGDGLAELAQQRLDARECRSVAADHDRQRALLGLRERCRRPARRASRRRPPHPLGERHRWPGGLTVLMST